MPSRVFLVFLDKFQRCRCGIVQIEHMLSRGWTGHVLERKTILVRPRELTTTSTRRHKLATLCNITHSIDNFMNPICSLTIYGADSGTTRRVEAVQVAAADSPAAMDLASAPQSLRPLLVQNEIDSNLPLLVGRIIQERGHFKNVTEESLQEEFEAQDKDDASDQDSDDAADKPRTLEARRTELAVARAAILDQLGQARNDIGMALDFVSLLLSKDRPEKANLTMSPFIKDMLKDNLGSLAFDSFDPPPIPANETESQTKVAMGWNLQRLGDSADSLLKSATRLESEMKKEAQYWEDVLSIKEEGWSVCRVGTGSTIGVHYGFLEAAAQFSAQGMAALRPDDAGHVKLDQGLRRIPKAIRVRIRQGERIISKSRVRACEGDQAPIEAMIRQARDSLFEEEMYHELMREARGMLPSGVQVNDATIVAPMDSLDPARPPGETAEPRQILIDLVPRSSDMLDIIEPDSTADTLALAMRILMTGVYHQKFYSRTQPPPPLSKDKKAPALYRILRPILSYTIHSAAFSTIRKSLLPVFAALKSASIESSMQTSQVAPSIDSLLELAATSGKSKTKRMERLVSALCEPLANSVTLAINKHKITIDVATHLAPPYYGTQYLVATLSALDARQSPPASFDKLEELRDYVASAVRQLIATDTAQKLPGWQREEGSATLSKTSARPAKRRKTVHVALEDGMLALMGDTAADGEAKVWGVWDGQGTKSEKDWQQVLEEATKSA
ncbi:hypothetical protein FH972_021806 [Carpinus fangiana]|uniref:Mediator of RNA polymerase II transcription subunit 17 n=1 Tax=Carpinus fangiana TaxID=176857 RepID=A0A5N6KQC7_9ROSI|nr:hypothetical protein FH972_021806 [Carpinus fangiana]